MSEPEPSRLHMPTNMGMGGTLPPLSLPPLSLPPIKTDHLGLSPLGMPYSAYPQTYHSPNIASPSNHLSSPQTPGMMSQPPGSPMGYVNGGPRHMPNSMKRRINPAERYPQQFQHPMMLPERPMENQHFAEPPMKQMKGIPGSPSVPSGPSTPSSVQMRFNMENSPGSSMNQSPMANQQSTSQMPNGNGYPPVFHHLSPHPMQHGSVPMMRPNQPQQMSMHYPPPSMPQQSMTNNNHRDMPGPSNGSLLSPMPGPSTSNLYHRPRMGYPENMSQSLYLQKNLMNSPYKSDGMSSTMSPVLPVPYPQSHNMQQMQPYPRSPMAAPVGYPPAQPAPVFMPPPQAASSSLPPSQTPTQETRLPVVEQKPFVVPKIEPPVITPPRTVAQPIEPQQREAQEAQCQPPPGPQSQQEEHAWPQQREMPQSQEKQALPKPAEQTPQPLESSVDKERPASLIQQVSELVPPPESDAPQPVEAKAKPPVQQKPKQSVETVKALLERRVQGSPEIRNNGQPVQRPPPGSKPAEQSKAPETKNEKPMELQRRLQEPPRPMPVKLAAPPTGPNGLPPNPAIQQRLQQAGLIPGPPRPPSGQGQPIPVAVRPLPPGANPQQILAQLGSKGQPVKMEQQQLSQGQLRQMIAERMRSPASATPPPKGPQPRLLHHQILPGQLHPAQAGMPVRSVLQAHQQLAAGRSAIGPVIVNPHGHPGLAGLVVGPPRRDPTVSLQLAKLLDDRMPQPRMTSKEQYRIYKRKFKYLVFENECYQEELRNLQRKLLKLSRDKNFLLDRLLTYEKVSDTSDEESDSSQKTVDEVPKTKKRARPNRPKKEAQPTMPVVRSPSGTPQDSPCPSPAPTTLLAQMLQPSTSSAKLPMDLSYPKPPVEEKQLVKAPVEQGPAGGDSIPRSKPVEEDKPKIKLTSFPPEMFMPGPSSNPTLDVAALMRAASLAEVKKPSQPDDFDTNGYNTPSASQQSPPPSNNMQPPSPIPLNGLSAPDHDPPLSSPEKMDTSDSKPV